MIVTNVNLGTVCITCGSRQISLVEQDWPDVVIELSRLDLNELCFLGTSTQNFMLMAKL